ncbi:MAG: M48 family metallopeptidase [Pseudomonadota bacterium]
MKKFLVIVIVLLLAGCFRTVPTFNLEPDIRARANTLFARANSELGTSVALYIRDTQEVNAWTEGDRMDITLGALRYDDDTITFIMAHELSHAKLNHTRNRKILSGGITVAMIFVGTLIPGAGLLNHLINPAAVNNFSKPQELEADKLASETCLKLGIPISKQIDIMNNLRKVSGAAGGFWSQHPSWDDRIQNISR